MKTETGPAACALLVQATGLTQRMQTDGARERGLGRRGGWGPPAQGPGRAWVSIPCSYAGIFQKKTVLLLVILLF